MISKRALAIILIAAIVIVFGAVAVWLTVSTTPRISFESPPAAIGAATAVRARIENPHGLRRVSAYLEQNGKRYDLYETSSPARRFWFPKNQSALNLAFSAGTRHAPALKDGMATLGIEATSNDLRGSTAEATRQVRVVTHPPSLSVDSRQHYINQGGAELVKFSVSGYAADSGVKVDGYTFRSFPVPGGQERFSLFAFPWDVAANTKPVVFASNSAEEVTKGFWTKVTPKKFRRRDLVLDDALLEKLDNQIDPGGSGSLVERFLKINGPLRRQNNQVLADLRNQTADRFLWSGAFLPLANSTVESQFADVRTYVYKGKKIDTQVHLGFDLAKVKNTPIPAANDGKVVLAEKLGIYGNCVVIDHGYTLQSIYGHLSEIQVKRGEMVKKGQIIGLSGSTGLAAGDHLHFSMQIDGVQVNPVEWWDPHWIHDRILSQIGGAR